MTIEQKAKAYDKALKVIKGNLNALNEITTTGAETVNIQAIKNCFYRAFPELKEESEDERIRKAIIESLPKYGYLPQTSIKVEDAIAWLEKQKERKLSAKEVLIRAGLKPYKDGNQWCILAGDNIQEGICGFGDTIEDAFCEFLKEVLDLQKEQKPVEFFDEYKIIKKHITEDMLSSEVNERLTECGWYVTDEKPEEWSEEDENKLNHILEIVHIASGREVSVDEKEELESFLKSLRPVSKESLQPHWKPSENQMVALSETIEFAPDTFKPKCTLVTLQYDLKKLMEE